MWDESNWYNIFRLQDRSWDQANRYVQVPKDRLGIKEFKRNCLILWFASSGQNFPSSSLRGVLRQTFLFSVLPEWPLAPVQSLKVNYVLEFLAEPGQRKERLFKHRTLLEWMQVGFLLSLKWIFIFLLEFPVFGSCREYLRAPPSKGAACLAAVTQP